MQFRAQLARAGAALALTFGSVMIGCSDSASSSTDDGALSVCDAHDVPTHDVVVVDSWLLNPAKTIPGSGGQEPGPCAGVGFCQPRQIQGVVTSSGRGLPLGADVPDGWEVDETRWINIAYGDHFWTIASRDMPDFAVREGSSVSASYFFFDGEFEPDQSALELRVGGKLAFYYGFAGGVNALMRPSELAIARRAPTCATTVDTCIPWSEYKLEMSVSGSKPVTLGTGQSKVVGDYKLKNFRSAMAVPEATSACSDAFVADTTVLVARTSPLSEQPAKDAGPDEDDGGGAGSGTRHCMLQAGACPGCAPIQGRSFFFTDEHPCLGSIQTIGCYPANEYITEDDRCAKSPDGQIFGGLSGSLVARLIAESGYSSCDEREEQAWNAASVCEQP
jgi:hypothetical protein